MNEHDFSELKALDRANRYIAHGELKDADCILGFSFGCRKEGTILVPGTANAALAQFIEKRLPRLPLVLQYEIADALTVLQPEFVIREHREKGKYLDSREVALQGIEYMKANNWTKAIVVTHSALEARNDYICTAFGITTIAPEGLEEIPYDDESAQLWTRDATSWWQREEAVLETCYQNGWLEKPILKHTDFLP